jgi:Flp pilus assembly protein TadD
MAQSPFNRNLAIIIAINDYKNQIPPLNTPVPDASELARLLEEDLGEHDRYEVQLLLNEEANRDGLEQLIKKLKNNEIKVSEKDRVLFYFAGHGIADDVLENQDGPVGYLIPQDAKLNNTNTYLPMQELHNALIELPCRHLLVILDCCFAGAFRWASLSREVERRYTVYKERYDRFIKDPAWQVITSAGDDQKALDSLTAQRGQVQRGEKIHSPFAQALFDALHGKTDANTDFKQDGILTATRLYSFLRDRVETTTEKHNKRQTPGLYTLKKHDKGEYIFLLPNFELGKLENAPPLNKENNPYRGLESYDEEHSHLFFGRNELIDKLYNKVVSNKLTVVLGASGTGKSSLVKAGLLPRLRDSKKYSFEILEPIRPEENPLTTLSNLVKGLANGKSTDDFATNTKALANLINDWCETHPSTKLLLIIDQFEELVTLCHSKKERKQFEQLLAIALKHSKQIHIIITLRLDFETQFKNNGLNELWKKEARFVVPPMTQDELREVIEKPALEKVLYFEPSNLVDRLINEVVQMPGALPLLSFTLSELYLKYLEARRDNRALTETDYDTLGGVVGSLTQRANQEYEQLVSKNSTYQSTIRHVMLRMISLQGGELARRQVLTDELKYSDDAENDRVEIVLEHFVDKARLIVRDKNAQNQPYVEPAHDALVQSWDKLLEWKQKEEENLLLQQRLLTPAANDRSNQQKKNSFLWHKNPRLDLLKSILDSNNNWLNQTESEFIQRSVRKKRVNTVRLWSIVTIVIVILAGISFVANEQRILANDKAHKISVDSAKNAASRGNWKGAFQSYENAIKDNYPDRIELEIKQLRAFLPLGKRKNLEQELAKFKDRDDLREHEARILLLRGDLVMSEFGRGEEGLALVRQALKKYKQIPATSTFDEADILYAEGLVAKQFGEAIKKFRAALEKEEFHYRANAALLTMLLFSGEFDKARQRAEFMRVVFEKDTLYFFVDAWIELLQGNKSLALKKLEPLRNRLEELAESKEEGLQAYESLRAYLQLMGNILDALKKPIIAFGDDEDLSLIETMSLVENLSQLGIKSQHPVLGEFGLNLPTVRLLFDSFIEMFKAYSEDVIPFFGGTEAAVRRLTKLSEIHPDGLFIYVRAVLQIKLMSRKYFKKDDSSLDDLKKINQLFQQAANTASIMPLFTKRESRIFAMWTDAILLGAETESRDLKQIARIQKDIRWLLDEAKLRPSERKKLVPSVVELVEPEIGRSLLIDWQNKEPKNLLPVQLLAQLELRAGNYKAALQAANRVLTNKPNHQKMQKVKETAIEKLQETLKLYQPNSQ